MLNAEKKNRRLGKRVHLNEMAWIIDPAEGHPIECILRDLSIGGVLVEVSSLLELPNYLLIKLPGEESAVKCRTAWCSEKFIGVEFV